MYPGKVLARDPSTHLLDRQFIVFKVLGNSLLYHNSACKLFNFPLQRLVYRIRQYLN